MGYLGIMTGAEFYYLLIFRNDVRALRMRCLDDGASPHPSFFNFVNRNFRKELEHVDNNVDGTDSSAITPSTYRVTIIIQ